MGHLGQMLPPPLWRSQTSDLKNTELYARPRSVYKIHESMYILLHLNSPETKDNQSQTNCEIVIQHFHAY